MSAPDQPLRNAILLALRREGPQTIEDLATLTGAPEAGAKSAVFAMANGGQVDVCEGYVSLAGLRPGTGRRP